MSYIFRQASQFITVAKDIIFLRSDLESAEQRRYSDEFRKTTTEICEFMIGHSITPSPENFSLICRHFSGGAEETESDVEHLVKTGQLLRADATGDRLVSEHELRELAEQAQLNLVAVEELLNRSSNDAKGFGDALEGGAQALADGASSNHAVDSLIRLTRTMIERTRDAEAELRQRRQAMSELQVSLSEAQLKADTDPLTGLGNRRAFERLIGAAGDRAISLGQPLSVAICDIDFFKLVNDSYGHEMGDRVLKFVGETLQANCGQRAKVLRLGGEEFVVLFEETAPEEAYRIVDGARLDISARRLRNKDTGERIGAVSFSAGIGWLGEGGDVGAMLRYADEALYRAKASGRDCVSMAPSG